MAKIIEKAEAKSPTSPFGVTCLNLALGKTGQLGDRMFQFYQNGTEGLLPHFQRDFVSLFNERSFLLFGNDQYCSAFYL